MTLSQPTFLDLGTEKFVSLTTFRRNGEPVSSPVWIAEAGDALLVTTPKESGKVKRLRNRPAVELRPCNRRGVVEDGAPLVTGQASIVDDDAARAELTRIFKAKYKLEYRIFMLIERIIARRQKTRVMLRITAPSGTP